MKGQTEGKSSRLHRETFRDLQTLGNLFILKTYLSSSATGGGAIQFSIHSMQPLGHARIVAVDGPFNSTYNRMKFTNCLWVKGRTGRNECK